jgi:predicted permease
MLAGLLARARSLWCGLRRRDALDADMADEFSLHLDLRAADLVRQGLHPEEASRRARVEFGHLQSHRETARDARGLRLFDQLAFSWVDLKLGLRMLRKYPGLSLVAVIGMSVAIALATGAVGFMTALVDPTLPLDQGGRIVSIQNNDLRRPGHQDRRALHDFLRWRAELTSVRDLTAFMTDTRNAIVPGRSVEPVRVAQMTASGFRVARVAPFLGRPLLEEDERIGAPPVVVIGYEEWQRRFDGDPGILGRQVQLGEAAHTVVGVMPRGFRFPVNHRYWVPLRLDPADYGEGEGPALFIFGRLADGVQPEQAQAELAAIGLRTAAAYPETHGFLRPRLLPYTYPYFDIDSPATARLWRAGELATSLLLLVVAVNVAILVYARTATRTGEIAVRVALGASRRRVVAQLFAEALVLSGTAAVLGLTIAAKGLKVTEDLVVASGADLPFWWDVGLSPGLVAFVAGLALLAGVIVGVLPALKATGRQVQAGLQQLSSRGSQMQLGRTWAAMIVVQVAVGVAILPYALSLAGDLIQSATAEAGYPVERFLRASLSMEGEEAPPPARAAAYERAFQARFRDRLADLLRRLDAEPAVGAVTFARHFPGDESIGRVDVEGPPRGVVVAEQSSKGAKATSFINDVGVGYFTVFGIPILAGRGFAEGDGREGSSVVIVDRVFAERVLGGGHVVGRRIRLAAGGSENGPRIDSGPWLEIVGVVPDVPRQDDFDPEPKLYRPVALAQAPTVLALAVRIRSGPAGAFATRLREITAALDPALQLRDVQTASAAWREAQRSMLAVALVVAVATASVLLLSAAGIYAMMSFTVARRRREIGIRQALGADSRHLLSGVFARASAQLGAGVAGGLLLAALAGRAAGGEALGARGAAVFLAAAGIMTAVGLLAAMGPARRGLKIQPTEALKAE